MSVSVSEINIQPFEGFRKIARWNRDVIVTEKLDGTNAQVWIDDLGTTIRAASRSQWITPEQDNYGFARWVEDHREELIQGLGPGRHFGEWWGAGIQRRYGLKEKRFSLFNTHKWGDDGKSVRPACCSVVPVLAIRTMNDLDVLAILDQLVVGGSVAAPGFMQPEGIVIFHAASGALFKMTIEKDSEPKRAQGKGAQK